MGWNRKPESIMEELRIGVDKLNKQCARRIFRYVHELSPIKTGRYRSNHVVSVSHPSTMYDARRRNYSRWYLDGLKTINSSPRGSSLFIQQNLPYNRLIEDGSSTQAPQGVYAVAVLRVKLL